MKTRIKLITLAVFLAVLVAVPVYATTNITKPTPSNKVTPTDKINANGIAALKTTAELSTLPTDPTTLKDMVPNTAEDTEARILIKRSRFLMWTHDLQHVMWGQFGNGYFVGVDNLGKKAWGIYNGGVFAGFYDGEFFYGRYGAGNWKAKNLFGLPAAYGRFTISPMTVATTITP